MTRSFHNSKNAQVQLTAHTPFIEGTVRDCQTLQEVENSLIFSKFNLCRHNTASISGLCHAARQAKLRYATFYYKSLKFLRVYFLV